MHVLHLCLTARLVVLIAYTLCTPGLLLVLHMHLSVSVFLLHVRSLCCILVCLLLTFCLSGPRLRPHPRPFTYLSSSPFDCCLALNYPPPPPHSLFSVRSHCWSAASACDIGHMPACMPGGWPTPHGCCPPQHRVDLVIADRSGRSRRLSVNFELFKLCS